MMNDRISPDNDKLTLVDKKYRRGREEHNDARMFLLSWDRLEHRVIGKHSHPGGKHDCNCDHKLAVCCIISHMKRLQGNRECCCASKH